MPDAGWVGDPPIRLTRYVRQSPTVKQHAMLYANWVLELLFGGAAGPGKSSGLLMAALQFVDVPGYSAIIFRRTFMDLEQPDALIPRSKSWLKDTDATYNANEHRWYFPSGATLTFAHLSHEDEKYNYQGAAYQFVGFDELTQFTASQYTYLFSRCRRPQITEDSTPEDIAMYGQLAQVPLRVRAASNPGGRGHEFVKERFGLYRDEHDPPAAPFMCHRPAWNDAHPGGRVFIPAKAEDNPHLDRESYRKNLAELDHHTRRQLEEGDWDSKPPGDLFRREWFEILDRLPEGARYVRYWDLAATEATQASPDPDWTAGVRVGLHPNGSYLVEDVERLRSRPAAVLDAIVNCAERDGVQTVIWISEDPGQAGKSQIDAIIRDPRLQRFTVKGRRESGAKFVRAQPVSSKAEHGLVKLKRATWNAAYLGELEAFTETDEHSHDDQVDGTSGAFAVLAGASQGVSTESYRPTGEEPTVVRGDLRLHGKQYVDQP